MVTQPSAVAAAVIGWFMLILAALSGNEGAFSQAVFCLICAFALFGYTAFVIVRNLKDLW